MAGQTGTGKNSTVWAFVQEEAKSEPVPNDLCYVNNFKELDKPNSIVLPPGKGCGFVKDMDELVETCKTEIPRAFESENYEKRRNDILNEVQQERTRLLTELQKNAEEMGLAIEMTQIGIVTVPIVKGKPLSREDFEKLPNDVKQEIQQRSDQLQDRIQQVLARSRKIEKEAAQKIEQLDKEVALFAVGHMLDEFRDKYRDYEEVGDFLNQVQNDILAVSYTHLTLPTTPYV